MNDVWSDETWSKLDSFPCPGCGQIVFTDTAREMCEECRLRQQVQTLTAALEWYADETHYDAYKEGGYHYEADISDDRGQQARAALAAVSKSVSGDTQEGV